MAEQQKIKRVSAKKLIERTVQYYLESRDFNGLPLDNIFGAQIKNIEAVKDFLRPLIQEQRITVSCDGVDINPFIKRFADLSPDKEIERLGEWNGGILVAYAAQHFRTASKS